MSGLAYLSCYGSESDTEESDSGTNTIIKSKLPAPNLEGIACVSTVEKYFDDPTLHSGRVRSFPHERGNWATYVFVKYVAVEQLESLLYQLKRLIVTTLVDDCFVTDDFHISVSKTVVLKFHQINCFTQTLREAVSNLSSLEVGFSNINVYCNEENTRTFVSLEVDNYTRRFLHNIVKKVDEALLEFKLPTFYEDASFHMSILWLNGNKKNEINKILPQLNSLAIQQVEKKIKTIIVDRIHCKSGNKIFQFLLQ